MDDSDSSSLSSAPSTDNEAEQAIAAKLNKPTGIARYFKPAPIAEPLVERVESPPPPKRPASPPHEYVLADNPDIAVRMTRSKCDMYLTRVVVKVYCYVQIAIR